MDEPLIKLRATSETYRLLSRAYYTPEASFLKGEFVEALREAFQVLALQPFTKDLEGMVSYLRTQYEPMELVLEYTRLFRGPVKAEAYPYESMYIEGEIMGKSALDVARRYREVGVHVSNGFRDLPDHISVELEFMHCLHAQELDTLEKGGRDEAIRFRGLAESFLKDHLARWVPAFADRILRYATTTFYLSLAKITREFIVREAVLWAKEGTSS